jgi:hypothetical protein
MRAKLQAPSKYAQGMPGGVYNPRPRLIDPALVPAARKGLSSPWAVSDSYLTRREVANLM